MSRIKNGQLYIGKMSALTLAKQYGTPLYVYEEDLIRRRYGELRDSITYSPARVYYACKANSNISILKILAQDGAWLDAVSPGEIFLALKAGFSPGRILFTGNNVTDEEMKFAVREGVLVNVDSLSQLERYGKINPNSKISVRINPRIGAGHHPHCITGGIGSKFGIDPAQIPEAKKIVKKYNLKIVGVHMHIGSGILSVEPFINAARVLLKVADQFDDLEFVDFGGGMGIPYSPKERPLDIKKFGKTIGSLFERWTKKYGKNVELAIEPGRYVVGESGILLTRVNTRRIMPYGIFIGTDTGFNHMMRTAMYKSYHPIIVANRASRPATEDVEIAGNLCESGDIFTRTAVSRKRRLPRIAEGDLLAILNAGAYGFSMSSNYNARPRPAEVLIQSSGKVKLIRKRETLQGLARAMIN